MSYEFFVARRYLTAKRKQAFISVITFISVLGISIGVMALIIAIALITGFQSDVQDKIISSTSHVMVSDVSGEGLRDYKDISASIQQQKGVQHVSPVVYDYVLIRGPYKSHWAVVRGMDLQKEKEETGWLKNLSRGNIPKTNGRRRAMLLGQDIAFEIGAGVGDVVTVLTMAGHLSPLGLIPKQEKFLISGIFNTGLYEFDASTALIMLEDAQKLFNMDERVTMINVKIENIFQAKTVGDRIKEAIPKNAYVTTWEEMNKALFSALKLEKKMLFLTITLLKIFIKTEDIL